jgi:predicted molibdopterin-dependent oxidoreductase YjgC
MGVCFECLMVIDGVPNTRACMTWVRDGMEIHHMDGLAAAEPTKGEIDDA